MQVIAAALLTLFLAAGVNFLVDPMGMFFAVRLPGVNVYKPEVLNYWRTALPLRAHLLHPEAAVLGSSRVLSGIDTAHPYFRGKRTANLGLPSATLCDVADAFEVAAAGGRLERAVVGLDFFAANAARMGPDCGLGESLAHPWRLMLLTLVSSDTLNASLKTVTKQRRVDPAIWQPTPAGSATLHPDYVAKRGGLREMFIELERTYAGSYYLIPPACDFRLITADGSQGNLVHLRRLLRSAHARRVELRLFFSPEHARLIELARATRLLERYRQWQASAAEVNREEAVRAGRAPFLMAMPDDPLWTVAEVPPQGDTLTQPTYFLDGSHYTRVVGNAILDSLDVPHPGGTASNFSPVADRAQAYLAARPDENAEVTKAAKWAIQQCAPAR